ncbi:hypothetical protein ITI46_16440 [Streptomyces oryzae]|uniref:Uncharacterized protein n=1 Tax=Streptomyces oryzae TaxID=1434886 RepID=A0ABS3XCZ9_9ACTN|nr:hypothetical protein [Streptomyces oryzae]MBO8193244.1 hypothetical protein [Streptomyces oryzae]
MERWDRAGRGAAYGAALALAPYLLIKVSWVIGSLLGLLPVGEGFDLAGWVLLNTVTIGMAGIGIALGLALVRPWGMRIPAPLVVFCAWTGSGFLVSVLPFSVLSTVLGAADDSGDGGGSDDPTMPGWEAALVQFGFIGMGLGLAVALPAYLRRRWPDAFAGRLGERIGGPAGGPTGERFSDGTRTVRPPWAPALAAAVGLVWLYWAVGGTLGLAHPAERNASGSLLTGVGACWALAGSAACWALARSRPARLPRRLPLAVCWLGSGSLFAWSGWKLPLTLFLALARPSDAALAELPENLAVAAVLHTAAIASGIGMLATLLRTANAQVPRQEAGPTAP